MTEAEFAGRVRGVERRLRHLALSILKNEQDCEDAVQEALLKAWTRRQELRDADKFAAWLARILVNECKNRKRRAALHPLEPLPDQPPSRGVDFAVYDALYALEEKHRQPLALHYLQGYGVDEIAELLKTRPSTVKSRLFDGREKFRALWKEADERK